ncbi:acyltransferase family protein [Hymenobacter daeguensis]
MGLLRLLLAIAVIISHSGALGGIQLVGGDVAVEAFFMISGFYMALVLNGKYRPGAYGLFISNRLLRLYPVYWVVLLLTGLVSVLWYVKLGVALKLEPYQQLAGHFSIMDWGGLLAANLFIVGQDVLLFLGIDKSGHWFFTNHYAQSVPPVYQLMFVHQAWSLSLEIMFYLVAPFLMRRPVGVLVLVAAASLLVRLGLYWQGLCHDPWSYRFFPSELLFFVVGALAYRGYQWLVLRPPSNALLWVAFGVIVGFTVCYQFVPGTLLRQVAYYGCLAVALPFVFLHTKDTRWLNRLGELSYPVYITHVLVLLVAPVLMSRLRIPLAYQTAWVVVVSILFSLLLIRYVAEPVERIRQRRVLARAAASR